MDAPTIADVQLTEFLTYHKTDAVLFLQNLTELFQTALRDEFRNQYEYYFSPPGLFTPPHFAIAKSYFASEGLSIIWHKGVNKIQVILMDDFVHAGPESAYAQIRKKRDAYFAERKAEEEARKETDRIQYEKEYAEGEKIYQETIPKFDEMIGKGSNLDMTKSEFTFKIPRRMIHTHLKEFIAHVNRMGFEMQDYDGSYSTPAYREYKFTFTRYDEVARKFADDVVQTMKRARVEEVGLVSE